MKFLVLRRTCMCALMKNYKSNSISLIDGFVQSGVKRFLGMILAKRMMPVVVMEMFTDYIHVHITFMKSMEVESFFQKKG